MFLFLSKISKSEKKILSNRRSMEQKRKVWTSESFCPIWHLMTFLGAFYIVKRFVSNRGKRKSRQIVGVQLPCGAKAQSLNIIIRIASPNIAEQVLTFYGWYNQISSMKASGGCEMHLHHLIYVCFRLVYTRPNRRINIYEVASFVLSST